MARTPSAMVPLGTPAPDFRLPDTDGRLVARDDFAGAPALLVMFLCNHCPYVVHVRDRLCELVSGWQARGIGVVGISCNDPAAYPEDGPAGMADAKRRFALPYPFLYDESQAVGLAYHAACTPDFFLYDKDLRLAYRGQLDDSRPGNGLPVTGADLSRAIDQVLGGLPVTGEQRPSIGCSIKWRAANVERGMPKYRAL